MASTSCDPTTTTTPLYEAPPKRSMIKHWCFTINNYNARDLKQLKAGENHCEYMIYGKEIAPSGTPHLQGYLALLKPLRISQLSQILPRAALFVTRGTPEEASKYCKKGEQSHEEWRELKWEGPNYGKNADFIEYGILPYDRVAAGNHENPNSHPRPQTLR